MSGSDTGSTAGGHPSPDVADLASLLPDADGGTGAGGDAQPGGDQTPAALAKYGNDPVKLANAYTELESRLGQQGEELGQVRKLLAAVTAQMGDGQGQAGEAGSANSNGDFNAFLEEVKQAQETGDVDFTKVAKEMWDRMQAALEAKQKPLEEALGLMNQAGGYNRFIQDNPDAAPYQKLMTELVRRKPYLLPENAQGQDLQNKLQDLFLLAKAVEAELRGGKTSVRRGSPDTGGTRRVHRRTEGDQQIGQAAGAYLETGRDTELHRLVQAVLSK